MPRKKAVIFSVVAWVVISGCLVSSAFGARKERVLYSFCSEQNCDDGWDFPSNLIFDAAGNLYGTTASGGVYNFGVVFELTPRADGTWAEKVLYNFCSLLKCADGAYPLSGLTFDAAGNLHGVTGGNPGAATVYQLAPGADGTWTESVLHSFSYGEGEPEGELVFDTAGNLYGATPRGGANASGTIFELEPQRNGTWSEKVLYTFQGGSDGSLPSGPLLLDASGNLYGGARAGGNASGTVYELIPQAKGTWKQKVLHRFGVGSDGAFPSNVVFDAAGSLYGTTEYGGYSGNGTIFRLTPRTNGRWKETLLRSFQRVRYPIAGLILDAAGNLYGTTEFGGPGCPRRGCGTVFRLNPATRGYREFALGLDRKGNGPFSSVILDAAGNLYGTTTAGGAHDAGVVFEVVR